MRVVELGPGPVQMTGDMLQRMGAEVISVSAPRNAAARGVGDLQFAQGKTILGLDLKSAAGQQVLHDVCRDADIVIEGFRPGVTARLGASYEMLSRHNQRLVYCSLSGYGQDGPYRDLPGHDLNFLALSGYLDLVRQADGDPAIPLNIVGDFAGGSLHATIGILLALVARGVTGTGQYIDVSYTDATFALVAATPLVAAFVKDRDAAPVPTHGMGLLSGGFPYYGVYRCSDGKLIALGAQEPHFWARLCELLDCPEYLDASYRTGDHTLVPTARHAEVRRGIQTVFETRSAESWFELLSSAGIPCTRVNTFAEALDDQQLRAREMVLPGPGPTQLRIGSPIRLSATPAPADRAVGQHAPQVLIRLGYSQQEIDELIVKGVLDL
jgi:crotonobetainyl-CoA:carnitine CoA-transferase CaiB-like acyl-CoA transferase